MKAHAIAAALLIAASHNAAIAQAETAPPPMQADQGWTISSSNTACFGVFGQEADRLSLRAERSYRLTGEPVLFVSALLDWKADPQQIPDVTLRIAGDDSELARGTVLARESGASASVRVEGDALVRLVSAGGPVTLEFASEGRPAAQFETVAFADDAALLDPCFVRLGGELMSARAPGDDGSPGERYLAPKNNPGRWITPSDYPSRALREELVGRAVIRLEVDRYGFPRDCAVLESSGHALLDMASCRSVMRRAEFYPSRDANSEAVEDTYAQMVRWAIPE